MEQFLINYKQSRKAAIAFLKYKFGSLMTSSDYAEAVDTAFFKLVLDSQKVKPTLVPADYTIRMLASNALIDLYRRRKREVLTDEYPLSMIDENDLCADKFQVEAVIAEIQNLSDRRKQILEEKYDMKHFSSDTHIEEIVAFKSRTRFKGCALAQKLNCPTNGAFRQELHNTVIQLRTRLLRA